MQARERGSVEDIDVSVGGVKIIFSPSDRELPAHLDGWTLYDVYVEDEYAGLATDTGGHSEYGSNERIWKALEGNAYRIGDSLNRDETAAVFARWYHGGQRGGCGE